jgi:hypothetical protein
MERSPIPIEGPPLTWREETLWTLFGFALLVVFVFLLIQDQT